MSAEVWEASCQYAQINLRADRLTYLEFCFEDQETGESLALDEQTNFEFNFEFCSGLTARTLDE